MICRHFKIFYLIPLIMLISFLFSCGNGTGTEGENKAPTAYAGEDRIVKLGESVNFYGHGSDPDGFITLYQWDLDGDGVFDKEFDYATTFSYSYQKAGIYKVTLRVTDDKGATAEDSCIIKAGYPIPEEGEENWNINENPILSFNDVVDSTTFIYNNEYYMLITRSSNQREYAKSNDGLTWMVITDNEFPCSIPDEAGPSNDIELNYINNTFTIVFSKGGSIYLGKSNDGFIWENLNNPIPVSGNYSHPTYLNVLGSDKIWATNITDNKLYFIEKPMQSSWSSQPTSIDEVNNSNVIFDGKTYYMWYTDKDKKNIYLTYSVYPQFSNNYIETLIKKADSANFKNIISETTIFDYQKYQYILYFIATDDSNTKIYIGSCNNFVSGN